MSNQIRTKTILEKIFSFTEPDEIIKLYIQKFSFHRKKRGIGEIPIPLKTWD